MIQKLMETFKDRMNQQSKNEPIYNTIDINRLVDLQNRNDRNSKVLENYIDKEAGVRVHQKVLYEIALDYMLTHEGGTDIIEIIQGYNIILPKAE